MTPTSTKLELDSQIYQGITGKVPQVPNHQTPQGTLQAPYSFVEWIQELMSTA